MKRLVLCDFDGTISTQDMGYVLLNRFSCGDWETIDREFCEGKIGSKEAYIRIAEIIRGSRDDLLNFVGSHSSIDPDFPAFYRYCRQSGMDVRIVSDGLDFYIHTVLEAHHLQAIPYYANHTSFPDGHGIAISFPYDNEECGRCGTCKKRLIQLLRKEFDRVLYIGNGLSDRCAAREADFVFAKDPLYTYCIDQAIPCHFFQDFGEILKDLKRRIRGVIFDLDGTLIESNEAIYIGLMEALRHFGKEEFPPEDLIKYLKPDLQTTLAQFLTPEEVAQAIPVMRKKYEEVYLDHTRFMDGAKEVIEFLYSRGITLGVASNKFGRFSRGAIAHLGVANYFKSVVGAGDVPRNKPFPDMIHACLTEMDLTVDEVVFVGDTLTDIETGKHAGVDVYALPSGLYSKSELARKTPRRILNDLKELVEWIGNPPF